LGAETNVLLKELSKQYVFFCAIGFVIGVVPAYLLLENGSKILHTELQFKFSFAIAFLSLLFLTLIIVLAKAFQVTQDVLKYLKYE
jgi:putative ABC transport system permease protein